MTTPRLISLLAAIALLPACYDHDQDASAWTQIEPPPTEDAHVGEAHVHTGHCGCGAASDEPDTPAPLGDLPDDVRLIDVRPNFLLDEVWRSEGAREVDAGWLVERGCAADAAPFSGPQRWTVVRQRPDARVSVSVGPNDEVDLNLFVYALPEAGLLPPNAPELLEVCATSALRGLGGGEFLEVEPTGVDRHLLFGVSSPAGTEGEARVVWTVY